MFWKYNCDYCLLRYWLGLFVCFSPLRLLVLDEMDQLDSKAQDVLYTIFEWPYLPKSRLCLIGKYSTQQISQIHQISHLCLVDRKQSVLTKILPVLHADHWCLCRYCKRSGSDWPDPAQTAGSSPVSPSAAALPSLQPGGAHGHCTGQACTGKCGLCDSELKLEPYRSLLFNQCRVFFSSGLGWRAPRRFCSSVLCQESFSCVGRRQESFGHLQVNAWTCFFFNLLGNHVSVFAFRFCTRLGILVVSALGRPRADSLSWCFCEMSFKRFSGCWFQESSWDCRVWWEEKSKWSKGWK